MKRDSVGFSYRYNVANIDPMPFFRKVEERKKELREDYSKEDYEQMISRIAVLELEIEGVGTGVRDE